MAEIDRLKANISFHEKLFFASLAVLVGLIGWIASHYQAASGIILFAAVAALIGALAFSVYQYKGIKKLIETLKHV